MTAEGRPVVTVFGAGRPAPQSDQLALAEQVGRRLAELGYDVANGGYGGTMAPVSRGARAGGAAVVGVTCRLWRSKPNAHLDRVIEIADIYERVAALIRAGSAGYVVLPGGTGTLQELAAAWEQAAKGHAPHQPIVCVGEYWRPLVELLRESYPDAAQCVAFVSSPAGLVDHFPPRRRP